MFLKNKKLVLAFGFLGWAILAFFTFWNIRAIFSGYCYFLSSWPFCVVFNSFGPAIIQGVILFVAFLALTIFGYFSFRSWAEYRVLFGWLATVLVLGAAIFLLPFASNDTQFYFSLGKSVSGGTNPYVQSWNVENKFYFPPSVLPVTGVMYGPLALDIFAEFYKLSGGSETYFILLWKIFMLLVLAVCGFLIGKMCNVSTADKKVFYIFWLTQPLLLFEWVGNGHFDGLWLLFVFLAFIFARQNRWGLVGISLIIGTWVKFIPLLVAPWFLLWWWQEISRINWPQRLLASIGGGLVAILISFLVWWPYWQGFKVFAPIFLQSKWAVNSLFASIYYTLKPLAVVLFANNAHWFLTRFLHLALFCLVLYYLWPLLRGIIAIFRRRIHWSTEQYSLVMFVSLLVYLFVWQKSFWPWYSVWPIVFGIINFISTKNIYLGKILIWLSAASLFFYVPWMVLAGNAANMIFYWYVVALIIFYPLRQLWLWRKINYSL